MDEQRRDTDAMHAPARELLHEAVRAQRVGRAASDAVRERARAVCACAREHGVPVEHVLIALKHEWRASAEARGLQRIEATAVLERVVTLCINEFYAGTDGPAH